jgi:NDP-sugar pyrophosphorylase family protein
MPNARRNGTNSRKNGRRKPGTRAVVLAGGRGARLTPYTSVLPKPLMPIGDRSILEIVIEQLGSCGITDVTLCVGYLSHLIEAVVGGRETHGVNVRCVREKEALGTAAPLRLVKGLDDTFIAMNGDVLSTIDYDELLRYHQASGGILTIATLQRRITIEYGVLSLRNTAELNRVYRYVEKPEMTSVVSMGVYVVEPRALEYIPKDGHFDFPDLVQALLHAHEPVQAYPYEGLWFDIGRHDDYEQAVAAWLDHPISDNGDAAQVTPAVEKALSR